MSDTTRHGYAYWYVAALTKLATCTSQDVLLAVRRAVTGSKHGKAIQRPSGDLNITSGDGLPSSVRA